MHQLYWDKLEADRSRSFQKYQEIFGNDYNLGFWIPKQDQCLTCQTYKNADEEKKKELEEELQLHQKKKDIAQAAKTAAREKSLSDQQV